MTLTGFHAVVANAFSMFTLIIAGWSLLNLIQRQELGGNFWGTVVVGELLVVAQTIIGIILLVQGAFPARGIHFLYGGITVLTWPFVFALTKGGTSRRDTTYWFLTSVFLFGIAMRVAATGMER